MRCLDLTLLLLQVLVAVAFVAAWYVLTTYPVFGHVLLPPFFFSNPVDVASQIVDWFVTGVIWKHLWVTLEESILAFVIGSFGGVLVGFWFARQPRTAAVFDPYVKMANALPRVVLAPIFTLWLGLGIWSKVALGVTLVFFIVFFNVYQGVKEVSQTVLANARMLGMSERQLMRHVYWPSALSWMFSSLHTSVGFAVVGAVVGEYLGSAAGLGYLIQQAEGMFDVAGVFAGMFVLAAFVIVIDMLVTLVEKRLLVWRPLAADAQALGRAPALAYRRRRNGLLQRPDENREEIMSATIFRRLLTYARRAAAVVGPRARAIQGHARHRRRRLPLLSADHARQPARRIRKSRRQSRVVAVQGRLGVAQGGDRRLRRRGVRLFRPLRRARAPRNSICSPSWSMTASPASRWWFRPSTTTR